MFECDLLSDPILKMVMISCFVLIIYLPLISSIIPTINYLRFLILLQFIPEFPLYRWILLKQLNSNITII